MSVSEQKQGPKIGTNALKYRICTKNNTNRTDTQQQHYVHIFIIHFIVLFCKYGNITILNILNSYERVDSSNDDSSNAASSERRTLTNDSSAFCVGTFLNFEKADESRAVIGYRLPPTARRIWCAETSISTSTCETNAKQTILSDTADFFKFFR